VPTILAGELNLGFRPNSTAAIACEEALVERATILGRAPDGVAYDMVDAMTEQFPGPDRPAAAQQAITLAELLRRKYLRIAFAVATVKAQEVVPV
jgi:hypothetical protein